MKKTGASIFGSYVLGYLWVCVFFLGFGEGSSLDALPLNFPVLLFALGFLAWGELSLKTGKGSGESGFWMVLTVLVALSMALRRNRATELLAYLAIHGFAGYYLLSRSGGLAAGESSVLLPLDLLRTFVILPFSNFFSRICRVFSGITRLGKGRCREGVIGIVSVAAALPVLFLAIRLLSQADASFDRLVSRFALHLDVSRLLAEILVRFLFSLPVGAYLYGMLSGAEKTEHPSPALVQEKAARLQVAPRWSMVGILSGFLLLYLLFFGVQANTLLAAFRGTVPGELTAAGYARQGFFQLCQVMGLNFGLLGVIRLLNQHPEDGCIRRLSLGLMGESLLLAVTAARKLLLYIERFGFTPLRLLSAWGILVLSAGCVAVICSLLGKKRVARFWIYFTAASFTLLCFY